MAKRYVTDACFDVADQALQLHGGYGYLREYGLEKIVRDLRVHRILEGTNEIMRVVIGRAEAARARARHNGKKGSSMSHAQWHSWDWATWAGRWRRIWLRPGTPFAGSTRWPRPPGGRREGRHGVRQRRRSRRRRGRGDHHASQR